MSALNDRADRFVRQVFLKKGLIAPATPAKIVATKILDRAAKARQLAVNRRKGY